MGGPGWAFPNGSRKAHYFVETRSLCGKWGFYMGLTEDSNYESPDNCAECKRRRIGRVRVLDQAAD